MPKFFKRIGDESLSYKLGLVSIVLISLFWIIISFWQNSIGYDQVIEARAVRDLTNGQLPEYGPILGLTNIYLPPNYYYIIFLFGFCTANTWPITLLNLVSQILSLYLSWKIIKKLTGKSNYSNWLALIGVWLFGINWAWFLLAVKIWNPNSLILFSLILILWLNRFLKWKKTELKKHFWEFLIFGFVIGFWLSFHGSSILVVPIFVSLVLIFSWGKKSVFPMLNIWLGGILAWAPYWLSESHHNWENTKNFFNYIFSNTHDLSRLGIFLWLIKKAYYFIKNLGEIVNEIYLDRQAFWLGLIIGLIGIFGLRFKSIDNKILGNLFLTLLGIFLLASANLQGDFNYHYKVLVLAVPIFGVLAFLSKPIINYWQRTLVVICVVFIVASFGLNIAKTYSLVEQRLNPETRDINTWDYESVLSFAKSKGVSKICTFSPKKVYQNHFEAIKYYNDYITKTNIEIKYDCELQDLNNTTLLFLEPEIYPKNLLQLKLYKPWQISQYGVYEVWW